MNLVQRPFKALVVGSSPTQPSFYSMAWVYMLRGSCGRYYIGATEDFQRRVAEHCRGKVHSTRRFGQPLEVVCTREMPSIDSARARAKTQGQEESASGIYLLSKGADQ